MPRRGRGSPLSSIGRRVPTFSVTLKQPQRGLRQNRMVLATRRVGTPFAINPSSSAFDVPMRSSHYWHLVGVAALAVI